MREHVPTGRHDSPPMASGEQQHVKDQAVQEPQHIDTEMPPARQADGVTKARKTDLSRQADRVLLRRPRLLSRHLFLEAEPVLARCAVPGPGQPRMVTEDLCARPEDEDHQEHVEEVLQSDPDRKTRVLARLRQYDGAGIPGDEVLDRRDRAQALRGRHRADQDHEADRKRPKEIEPPVPADTHTRRDAVRFGEPLGYIDGIPAPRELLAKTTHTVGRHWRWGRALAIRH